MLRLAAFVLGIALGLGGAKADAPYIDNRSDAAALIRSLYSAVNRKEYARAWGYFAPPPARDFETFVRGYETTKQVELAIGAVRGEGTAGSSFFTVPVAIKARNSDNSEKVFAGCYTVRQVNPQNQEPPFRGLQIEKGALKPSDATSAEGAVPEDCAGGGEPDEEGLDEAISAYLSVFAKTCDRLTQVQSGEVKPDRYEIQYKSSADAETVDSTAELYRFPCNLAAYNESAVYLLKTETEPLKPIAFPEPVLDIQYDGECCAKIKSVSIAGYEASFEAVNSDFDPKESVIITYSKWRGLGDSSSNALYIFKEGRFVLWDYDVDPTEDEEINPTSLIKSGKLQ